MREILKKKKTLICAIALVIGIFGTTATFAVIKATTNTVTNTFEAGDVKTRIDEEVDPTVEKNSTVKKTPKITNEGKSDAFVRARITISPEKTDVTLLAGTWNGKNFTKTSEALKGNKNALFDADDNGYGWYLADDGWYYYNTPIAKGKSTETLFDAVKVGKVDKNFDITIYQEAVYSGGYKAGDTVELDIIKAAFDAVEDSSN